MVLSFNQGNTLQYLVGRIRVLVSLHAQLGKNNRIKREGVVYGQADELNGKLRLDHGVEHSVAIPCQQLSNLWPAA